MGKKNRGLNLPPTPSLFRTPFDGIDDYVSIDNSGNSGNPYDLGTGDSFSLAGVLIPVKGSIENSRLFEKRTANSGFVLGTATDATPIFGWNSAIGLQGIRSAGSYVTPQIMVATYDGSGNVDGMVMYLYALDTGALVITVTSASTLLHATKTLTGTLKNTTPIIVGKNYPGGTTLFQKTITGNLSIWNKTLSSVESQELANKIISNSVESHSSYTANCKGYWKKAAGKTLFNEVVANKTYLGRMQGGLTA